MFDVLPQLPLFNVLPGANLVLTPDLQIAAVSDGYVAVSLVPRAELLGQALLEVFPDNPAAPTAQGSRSLRASLEQVLATSQPHQMAPLRYDIPNPAAPGQFLERYWQTCNTPLLDAQGQVQYLIHSVQDITASRLAEEQLRESQAREYAAYAEANRQRAQLHNVLEQAPAMICIFEGPQHIFQFVNPPYQALVGRRPLLGRPIADAMPELTGQPIFSLLDRVYQTGEPYHATEMLVQLDHDNLGVHDLEQRYYNFIYQARYNLQGAIDGIMVFAYEVTTQVLTRYQVQDLNEELAAANEELRATNEEFLAANTDLLRTQQQLQQFNQELDELVAARTREVQAARLLAERQQQQLERLFMQAPAAVCILSGPELVYELVNPGYQQLFPGRLLLRRPILAALPEIAGHAVYRTLRQVYETGIMHEDLDILIRLARPSDGALEDRYFNYIQQARYDEQGQIDGVLVFAFEVTEQVRARQQMQTLNEEMAAMNEELQVTNEALNSSNAQLTRTNVDLDNFIYTASHDLKAPITNIEGLLLALREQLPAGEAQPDELVPHLLQLMQGSIERFQATISQLTDIARLQRAHAPLAEEVPVAAAVEAVRLDLEPLLTAAAAQLTVEVAPGLCVSFAPQNLRSVVYNLLSNAIKYHAPNRPPVIVLRAARADGLVTLAVQDNGLGLDAQQQTQLYGIFRRLHTHVAGTGVGLYMVKRMVENAGGTIAVQSEPNVGTTFTVTFLA
ncbi:PAS domain-containing sensor histidine kinase [Hymenobacter ginkgonis]|uniref:PAS domain-containing sensor histidine kinase n=1 Tax=Hymenobacter ginkgonis TaxID=2682976 RepID=UPI0018DC6715|nr:PAS domain-containing protein [Hymenobacter ginkgonis]